MKESTKYAQWLLVAALPPAAIWLIRGFGLESQSTLIEIATSVQVQIATHVLWLLGACMLLHGELYRLRPPASSLTAFYLCVSAGGALGGIFVGALAPRIFDDYRELELGLLLGSLLLLAACAQDTRGWLSRAGPRWRWGAALAFTATVVPFEAVRELERPAQLVHQERSFFGVLRVNHVKGAGGEQRQLGTYLPVLINYSYNQ